jgi:hypothetical protein
MLALLAIASGTGVITIQITINEDVFGIGIKRQIICLEPRGAV